MNQILYISIYLLVMVAAYLIGKYVTPFVLSNENLKVLSAWVYKFVVSAENQFGDGHGTEQRDYVTELIKTLAKKAHITLTDEQIRALIEDAYTTMKQNEDK
jgi:LL-H family phage holin